MIVVDSSFLVAFHNRRDVHHAAAADAMEDVLAGEYGDILLPEYVFMEVTTVLAARRNLAAAVTVGEVLLRAREIELVPCFEYFEKTFNVFRTQRAANPLSFADAAIVVIAAARGAGYVATFDRGFNSVEGIKVVPSGKAA